MWGKIALGADLDLLLAVNALQRPQRHFSPLCPLTAAIDVATAKRPLTCASGSLGTCASGSLRRWLV